MTFEKLSSKQKIVFQWCYSTDYKAIICDGAVRSGKTICMITSFILWAMHGFKGENFGICGKTVASAERNIIRPLQKIIDITSMFTLRYVKSDSHLLTITSKLDGTQNFFYVFGGRDESSQDLVQGITLSGILLDEVALMPESFVNQAIARCLSVEKSRYWFNCNPESPAHWFYNEYILKHKRKKALHVHFLMNDNPTMTKKQLEEAEMQFSGVFYDRYIRGLWVVAEGLIYPNFRDMIAETPQEKDFYGNIIPPSAYVLSIDYGTQNPFSAGLWAKYGDVWYRIKEYYYSGRDTNVQKTDESYGNDLDEFIAPYIPDGGRILTIVDPSAASFITLLRGKPKYKIRPADNDVLDGIRETASAIQLGRIKISTGCKCLIRELEGYVWDKSPVEDRPVKVNDHACDDMRYFVKTMGIAKHKLIYQSRLGFDQ